MSRANRHELLALALLLASGCVFPATEVTVELDSDAPRDRPMDIRVTVVRGADITVPGDSAGWGRDAAHPAVTLPASFAVTPTANEPRDDLVTLSVEARLPARTAGESDIVFRRLARFQFVPRVDARLPIFLSTRCGAPAVGCTTSPCTVASLCEQSGQTCGDDGSCVSPMTSLIVPGADAAMDSHDGVGMDAIVDAGIDVQRDAVVEAGVDAADARDIPVAGMGAPGAPCVGNGDCASNHCMMDANGRGLCTSACTGATMCPATWSCVSNICTPPLVCGADYAWGDPYGDNSVRLRSSWHLGLSGGTYSYSYACAQDMSVIDLCGDSTVTLGGGHATVIGGIGVRPIGVVHALTINQSAIAPLFMNLDAAARSTTLTINAPGSDVYIRSVGPAGITINGAMCHFLTVDADGPITTTGTLTFTGGFRPGAVIPTPPACP